MARGASALVRRVLIHLLFAILFCVAWATCGQILRLVLALIFARSRGARSVSGSSSRLSG